MRRRLAAIGAGVCAIGGCARGPSTSAAPVASTAPGYAPTGAAVGAGKTGHVRGRLRATPATLTAEEVKIAIVADGLHCEVWNEGVVVEHDYERKIIEGVVVVIDHTFRLMWQDSDVPRAGTSDRRRKREEAIAFVRGLNAAGFAGFRDWRLPTLEEAMSLMTDEAGGTKVDSRRGWLSVGWLPLDKRPADTVVIRVSSVFDWSVAPMSWTADLWASDDPADISRSGMGVTDRAWIVDYANGEPLAEEIGMESAVRAVRSL